METMWKEVTGSTAVRVALIGVLAILALFLFVEVLSQVQQMSDYVNPNYDSITVDGEGTATAIPDTATVSFSAQSTAADVATAQANVTTIVNNALASVKSAGISSDDVTTTDFSVSPHYSTPVCPPGVFCPSMNSTVSGYDVSETVSVKIHDTSKVAAVLSGLASAKVTNVTGPDFVVDDPSTTIAQARAQAIQKAQADAQVLASQLGVRLGKIMSYSDNSNDGSGPEPMMASASSDMKVGAVATPAVPVGNNTYTEDISITYEIH